MLFGRKNKLGDSYETPIFGTTESGSSIPKEELGKDSIAPNVAYRLIKDELMNEGNARLNLCTFCQTYMEDEATKLMAETLEKNAIDKSEYPQTTEMENRCVNMIANLWHAPEDMNYIGTSTVGSSEACMLGGMAMKFRWRNRAKKLGMDVTSKRPNLVVSSGYQVCWEKFCVYWDIEMRLVPMDEEHMSLNIDKVLDYVD
ncbi:pyridoxal-dependent decarboxylase, partial [Paraclostridium sordellii]